MWCEARLRSSSSSRFKSLLDRVVTESSDTEHTFSFKCSTNTITASTNVATTEVSVTQGIHSPGRKNSSFFHASSPLGGGKMTTLEFGMTPSMFSQCFCVCLVEPTNKFSM